MTFLAISTFGMCRIVRVLIALLLCVSAAVPAQEVGVRIRIRINAESVEALHAWRRANHLDPPDAEADAKFRERLAANARNTRDAAAAARERRRLRTVELLPISGTENGLQTGTCAALPVETDPCTIVVQYRPETEF